MNKHLIAIVLMICLLLVGCGKPTQEPSVETTLPETAESTAAPATTDFVGGSLDLDDPVPQETQSQQVEQTVASDEIEATEQPAASEPAVKVEVVPPQVIETEYSWYMNLSGAEQKEYMDSFASVEEFFVWLNNAKAEHERLNPEIEVENGAVDLVKAGN